MAQILEFEKPILEMEEKIQGLRAFSSENTIDLTAEIKTLEEKLIALQKDTFDGLTPWDRVRLARHPDRPTTEDYIKGIFTDFIELKGDRAYGDDSALIGGVAMMKEIPVTVIGHQKGRDTKENIQRNFGMPHPEGYRKALRLMEQAEKFKRPVITFVDTSGAYCGLGAEERGQGHAIAQNLLAMARLKTPILTVVIGEGGSGGALGIGVGDQVAMLSSAVYSVISPEGLASILWKDASKAQTAAGVMKLTAKDLERYGVIDELIEEPVGGAHRNTVATVEKVKQWLMTTLRPYLNMSCDELLEVRYDKYKKMGQFSSLLEV